MMDVFSGIVLGFAIGLGIGVLIVRGTEKPCDGCDWCERARKAGL